MLLLEGNLHILMEVIQDHIWAVLLLNIHDLVEKIV